MIHIMKLKEQYFDYIKYGTKEYEIRLNDEKRRNIRRGDFIEFQKEFFDEKMIVMVEELYYYKNFDELFNDIKIDYLADITVKKEQLEEALISFYPIEKQEKYGYVAIKLKKNNIISYSSLNSILSLNNIFEPLRESYTKFDSWFTKMQSNNINAFYTEKNKEVTSIMILKINEIDSQQFFLRGNIMKIRTLIVNDKNKGIGTTYLKIIDEIAKMNRIDYIYLTIKMSNKELIKFVEKKDYKRYNQLDDEFVYYKSLG